MRREMKIILATVLLAGLWTAGGRVPGWLDEIEAFLVRDVEVRGTHHLGHAEVRDLLALQPGDNIWDDADPWTERILRHSLVADARIRRRLPGTLIVEVVERVPVALVATPTLVPVDAEGMILPLDPADTRLDLPIVAAGDVAPGARLVPAETRRLIAEVARLTDGDTAFLQMVSEVGWAGTAAIEAHWTDPRVTFLLHPGTPADRFREGLLTLDDAMDRDPLGMWDVVDLRFADQVVVRRSRQES